MPFTVKGKEPLTAKVDCRLTPGEKDRLTEDAEFAGISRSELLRRRYFGRPIIASTDLVMVRELRRIGGLLKNIHNESQGAYSHLTASTLVVLRKYIERLKP